MRAVKYLVFILVGLLSLSTRAQGIRFTAASSASEVNAGEAFEISYTLNGNSDDFNPPALNGLQVVGGPNVSSSMSSINGNMSSSVTYSYYIVAPREGTYNIGPASISVRGKVYKSNGLVVRALKGNARNHQNPAPQAQAQSMPDNNVAELSTGKLADNLFLRAAPARTSVYVGQSLPIDFKLYTRVSVLDLQADKVPDMNGFWSEEIKNSGQQVKMSEENYKGRPFKVATLKQNVLFADHAGALKIEPMEITTLVRQQAPARSVIDQLFGGTYEDVNYKLKSPAVVIQVKPLPEAGKPAGFNGAVGRFTIRTSLDKREIKANEPLTLQIKIAGTGNLKLLSAPQPDLPQGFEKYDPKITDSINVGETGMSGSRTFSYVIIPRNEGKFSIPGYRFSYFDPQAKRYIEVQGDPFEITVLKGDPGKATVYDGSQSEIREKNKDIAFIKLGSADITNADDQFYGSWKFFALVLLALFLFLGAYIYRRLQIARNSDPLKVRSQKAAAVADKRLAAARKAIQAGDQAAFYEEVSKALYDYLSDRFNIPKSELNRTQINERLLSETITEDIRSRILELLDTCEMARYAPVSKSADNTVLQNAKNTIYDIEKSV